ncbi:MAG: type I methionyl aminopeptidase [bacterium]|nr:type I methionyl aminopeptidase [bacterium]
MSLIKTPDEIKIIKQGGKILAGILKELTEQVEAGMSTMDLENYAQELFKQSGGSPSFQNYDGFPTATCISVNDEVVHGIPRRNKIIKEGDIVGIDVGLKYKGLFTDTAVTVPIGKIDKERKKLLKITQEALNIAILKAKPGNFIGDIGQAVQNYVEKNGYSVVRSLVGHGVGHEVHEAPRVPNFGEVGTGELLREGMVLALEPMVNIGTYDIIIKKDGWTIATADGSLSAHFEHTVAITKNGARILTK